MKRFYSGLPDNMEREDVNDDVFIIVAAQSISAERLTDATLIFVGSDIIISSFGSPGQ